MKILFVCTGNLCRSPMAAGLFKDVLERRGCDDVEVTSAGTWAASGHSVTPEALATLRGRGIDLAEHRSRPFSAADADEADLIVAMTSVHAREIAEIAPHATDKVVLLKVLADVCEGCDGADAPARLHSLLSAPRPQWVRAMDVDDPIGLPLSAYERCAGEIAAAVDALADALCGTKTEGAAEASR